MEDPIAVPISKLEQNNHGEPKEFNDLLRQMVDGKEGKFRIEKANRLLPKVFKLNINKDTNKIPVLSF